MKVKQEHKSLFLSIIIVASIMFLLVSISFSTLLTYFEEPIDKNVAVIAPFITANAYAEGGYYDYFRDECDESCLTVELIDFIRFDYRSSNNALALLQNKYDVIADDELHGDVVEHLSDYNHLILLHNEYVTKEMYNAVRDHPSVFYLYPNALYGEVIIHDNKATLINGHSVNGTDNGFAWEYDNTHPDEFDNECIDYLWIEIDNGYQINCYPENAMLKDDSILQFIKDKVNEK